MLVLTIAGCGGHPAVSRDSESTGQLLMGVGASTKNLSVQSGETFANRVVIDAGIVFADEPSYLCFPLSCLGIDQADSVEGMHSSCECIRPSLVRYLDHRREIVDAMRLDFVSERFTASDVDRASYQPSLLSVELKFVLANGEALPMTVDFLRTLPNKSLALGAEPP